MRADRNASFGSTSLKTLILTHDYSRLLSMKSKNFKQEMIAQDRIRPWILASAWQRLSHDPRSVYQRHLVDILRDAIFREMDYGTRLRNLF